MIEYISYILFRFFMFVVHLWPQRLLYLLSNVLHFILFKLIRYRKRVIKLNLEYCFKNLSKSEFNQSLSDVYKNLSDILVETIKGFTLPIEVLNEKYTYSNTGLVDDITSNGESVILAGSHIANWEWGVSTIGTPFNNDVYGVYKPVKNKYISDYIDKKRKRSGMLLCPISNTRHVFDDHHADGSIFLMLGDQNPSNKKRAHHIDFLNNTTSCLHGIGHYAKKYNLKVFYLDVKRIERGQYQANIKKVCMDPSLFTPEEITGQYMRQVEENIKSDIGSWLWTHKRWKIRLGGHSLYD